MTLLPSVNKNVKGLKGAAFPKYKVGPVCCVPGCSRHADHAHHLWRRSFVIGDCSWVQLWDGRIIGNLVPLCWRHHEQVTVGKVWMRWDDENHKILWDENRERFAPAIVPQPPAHQTIRDASDDVVTMSQPEGPASNEICPDCKRPLPHKQEGKRQPARRRKSWTVSVPVDAQEDGALVLDTLLESCRELFAHAEETNVRYFTIVQALALVVQHGHLLTSESAKPLPDLSPPALA